MVTVAEYRLIHSLFLAVLEQQFTRPVPIPDAVEKILQTQDSSDEEQPLPEAAVAWLDLTGAAIHTHRLRRYGQENGIAEPAAQALLRFWASRRTPTAEDRDKADWLGTHIFRAREAENKEPVGWVKNELQSLLKGIPFAPLSHEAQSFLGDLPPLLDDARYLGSFSQIPDSRILDRGRELKAQIGEDFCNPVALAAVINYNVVVGKKFDELLDRAVGEPHETSTGANVRQLREALRNDYHSNAAAIQQLADLTRKQPAEKTEVQADFGPEPLLDHQLQRMGIDSKHELAKLRGRIRDLVKKLMADPTVRSIRICGSPLSLNDWEVNAFRSLTTKREENLQGAFARTVSRAMAFVVRIYEELYAYETKKGTGDAGWKKHHDALFYVLYEGRGQKTSLLQLALLHRKSGFPDLAQQLVTTAEKLDANLARIEELF
ncbi:MAG: hypothetical protein A3H28_15950 [Acidobacteria bacterium RIFCSPLOWO2_02_FULL_61_28]|nr:MAG: hypothetical protein A3H28_15950 [Acidobacteria bacterium RIFCSPLOWO2_02_FULL_61_28]